MYSPGTNNCTSQDSCLQKTEVTLNNLSKKINLLKKKLVAHRIDRKAGTFCSRRNKRRQNIIRSLPQLPLLSLP